MGLLLDNAKKDGLTTFLRTVSKNTDLIIHTINKGANMRFAIAIELDSSAIDLKSDFMTYEGINTFLFGVMAVKDNRINF